MNKIHQKDTINYIIKLKNYQSYLEIGTDTGTTFNAINIKEKECCDPIKKINNLTYHMTSDKLFEQMPKDKKYDIIFIDGLHHEDQVDKDIVNSFKHLNKDGVIVMHDILPSNHKFAKKEKGPSAEWYGDVWKSLIKLPEYIDKKNIFTLFFNQYGLGLIKWFEGCDKLEVTKKKIEDSDYDKWYDDTKNVNDKDHLTKFFYENNNVLFNKEELNNIL